MLACNVISEGRLIYRYIAGEFWGRGKIDEKLYLTERVDNTPVQPSLHVVDTFPTTQDLPIFETGVADQTLSVNPDDLYIFSSLRLGFLHDKRFVNTIARVVDQDLNSHRQMRTRIQFKKQIHINMDFSVF